MERSVERSQRGDPQGQALHAADDPIRRGLDLDVVAHAELVLEQDEEAGERVPHETLRAEPEGHAGHAGAGEQRRDVLVELSERHQDRDDPDHHDQGGRQRAGEGSRPLEVRSCATLAVPSSRFRNRFTMSREASVTKTAAAKMMTIRTQGSANQSVRSFVAWGLF